MSMTEPTLDALPSQVAVLDNTGAIVHVNRAWMDFAAENQYRGPDFVGLNYLDLCRDAIGAEQSDAAIFGAGLNRVLSEKCARFEHVYTCHAPHQPRWFKGLVQRSGQQVLVMHVDITAEFRRFEIPSYVVPAKDLIHDFLSPLSAISGFAELSMITPHDADDGRQLQDNLRTIHQASLRLTQMISEYFADEPETLLPSPDNDGQTDLGALMTETVQTFAALAERAGVKLHFSVDTDDAMVRGGETVYWKIMSNLIANAVKFNRLGGAAVCSLHRNETNGIEIEIADTGIGITQDLLDRLSAPYDGAHSTDDHGPGIGLNKVKKLSDGLSARFNIESAKGEGTTVKIILPAWRTVNTALAS